MNLTLTLEDAMMGYTIFLVLLVALVHGLERIQDHARAWSISRSELMSCRHCGTVYLQKRQDRNRRCPVCGQRAVSFRLPYSGIREKAKQKVREI